jgi:cytochrome c oxidase subunit 2
MVTNTWIQADEPGVYRGAMRRVLRASARAHGAQRRRGTDGQVSRRGFGTSANPRLEPVTDQERHGRDVFMQSPCVTCHAIRGTDAGSHVGPELTHVASRLTLAAGTLPNARGHLAGWISNSQSIKPGNRMPPNSFAPADFQALLAYVRSLR